MRTTTFFKQVRKLTKEHEYVELIKHLVINEQGKVTIAAIYAVRLDNNDDLHYTIYYAYDSMRKVDNVGYFTISPKPYKEYDAYEDACDELAKFA